jgi:hypothetical protein
MSRCECRGECGKRHLSGRYPYVVGQCRSETGKNVEDARHPTILRLLDGKRYCQSCHARFTETIAD